MLDHLILMISLLGSGHVGLGTIFGSSHWDRSNPHSRLACLHREINDQDDMIIAHNTLPCGQRVWIFNPRTGLSVVARVADRGPRHAYADLSLSVAHAISHNGKENILLVPLPTPSRRGNRAVVLRRVPAPVEESWDVGNPDREVPFAGAAGPGPSPGNEQVSAGLRALIQKVAGHDATPDNPTTPGSSLPKADDPGLSP